MSKKENTTEVNNVIMKAKSIFIKNYNCTFEIPLLIYGILETKCLVKYILNEKYKFSKSEIRRFIEEYDDKRYYEPLVRSKQVNSRIDNIISESKQYVPNNIKAYSTNDLAISIFNLLKNLEGLDVEYKKLIEFFQKYGINIDEILKDIKDNLCNCEVTVSPNKTYFEEINYKNIDYYIKLKKVNETYKNKKNTLNLTNFEKYATNMTKLQEEGSIDPVIGREKEISRIITILSKRIKNNPIILGEPGIGKTAIVEGLVQRIMKGNVPSNLKNKVIFNLNLTSLISGTKYRGDLEERINSILKDIVDNENIIIFIDEIHTIMGSGKTDTSTSISDILKPYLSRGRITIIGATTLNEYKATIEKDGALERRFQPVILNEPTKEETFKIICGIKNKYEKYHNVKIDNFIINYIIDLSIKYITDRNLPDKAIDLLDEACVWNKMNNKKSNYLSQVAVRSVISSWKNLNVSEISNDEFRKRKIIKEKLKSKVIGQDEVIDKVLKRLNLSVLGFIDENRPKASFLFLGSSGVGKTFLAKMLAENLYDEKSLIRLDMSEYMDKESVNKIIGSPPGFIGFDSTNTLTEKVRRNAQSIVLFDEIDKAHPDVINLLLQVLDEGFLNDSYGRKINFQQTIVILTANSASYNFNKTSVGFASGKNELNSKKVKNDILNAVKKSIKKEILDRLDDVIVFNDLTYEDLKKLLCIEISNLKKNFKKRHYNIKIDDSVYKHLFDMILTTSGARQIKTLIKTELYDYIIENILSESIKPNIKYTLYYSDKYEIISKYNLEKIEVCT